MIDTQKLRKLVNSYELHTHPSSASGGSPATVEDINKVVRETAAVLRAFIKELENQ